MHRDTHVSAPSAIALAMGAFALTNPLLAEGPTADEVSVSSTWELRAALSAGEKDIYLEEGKYDLGAARLWLGSSGDQLSIRGAGREETVLYTTGSQDALIGVRGGNVTIQDIGLDSSKAQSKSHTAIDLVGTDIQVLNTDIIGSNSSGMSGAKLSDIAIVGNRFIDNGQTQNHQLYFISDVKGAVIADNQFEGSDAEMAIKLRTAMNGSGALRNVALVGNTVEDKTGYGSAIGADNPVRDQTLENFILAENDVPSGNIAAVHDAEGALIDSTSKALRSSNVTTVNSIGGSFKEVNAVEAVLGLEKGEGDSALAVKSLQDFLDGDDLSVAQQLLVARLLSSNDPSSKPSEPTEPPTTPSNPTPTPEPEPTTPPAPPTTPTPTTPTPPVVTLPGTPDPIDGNDDGDDDGDVMPPPTTGGPVVIPGPGPVVPEPTSLIAALALGLPLLRRRR